MLGVDFSPEMLKIAREKVKNNSWKNIELIEADVTDFGNNLDQPADVGVCTLGLSIIPDFKKAYFNLRSNVKDNGEIIIGDMQLASGWKGRLNPFTVFLAKRFGGTYEGHQNSLELYSIMQREMSIPSRASSFLPS